MTRWALSNDSIDSTRPHRYSAKAKVPIGRAKKIRVAMPAPKSAPSSTEPPEYQASALPDRAKMPMTRAQTHPRMGRGCYVMGFQPCGVP